MKTKFEISIGDVEGLEYGPYEYKINLNTTEQYLYEADTFEIQGEGNLTFSVLQNNFALGGFTIPIHSLERCSKIWFPLSTPFEGLEEMPCITDGPRIAIGINPADLCTVQECSEYSNESPLFSPRVFPDNNLMQTLRQELQRKTEVIGELEEIVEKAHTENSRLQGIVDEIAENFYRFQNESKEKEEEEAGKTMEFKKKTIDLTNDKIKLTEEVLSLKRQIEILQCKLSLKDISSEKIEIFDTESICARLKESETKRKELQQLLNSSNTKWCDIKISNHTLTYLEKENKNLISKVKTLSEQISDNCNSSNTQEDGDFMKQVHSLSIKLNQLKQKNKDLKGNIQLVEDENHQYKEIIEQFRNDLSKQAEENSDLSKELKVALTRIPHRDEKIDQIDDALKRFFKEAQMKNPFVKISEGVYNFGNKRLCFSLKNGFPVVRVGGGYMFVDEFLKMYNAHSKKKEEAPIRSQSLEGKPGSTSRLKNKIEIESEIKVGESDSLSAKSKQEIKILKKTPRRVFIP